MTTTSPYTGQFDRGEDPSIVESMIRTPERGAIAVVAPSRHGPSSGQEEILSQFWEHGLGQKVSAGAALSLPQSSGPDSRKLLGRAWSGHVRTRSALGKKWRDGAARVRLQDRGSRVGRRRRAGLVGLHAAPHAVDAVQPADRHDEPLVPAHLSQLGESSPPPGSWLVWFGFIGSTVRNMN